MSHCGGQKSQGECKDAPPRSLVGCGSLYNYRDHGIVGPSIQPSIILEPILAKKEPRSGFEGDRIPKVVEA